jgi:hypothetical protein
VFKQAAARLRRPTQTQKVEIVYLNMVDTIVAQALELMFEKLTAAAIFRGESVEGTLGTVAGSGRFLAELMKRVVENARVDNLEAMFARYNRLEADNEGYFQDYDLSSYETVETVSRRKTVAVGEPVNGKQLVLL